MKRVSPDEADIQRFLAEHGVTECPPNRGTLHRAPVAKHRPPRNANRARKQGLRYANGHRKPDPVDDMTDVIPSAPAEDSYVIGQLYLGGHLADPVDVRFESVGAYDRAAEDARRRFDAANDYAILHFRIWGPGTAPSHLRNVLAAMHVAPATDANDAGLARLQAKWREWERLAMTTPPCGRLLGIDVLRRAALYEMAPDNAKDLATLRRVLDRFVELKGGRGRRDTAGDTMPAEKVAEYSTAAADTRAARLDRYQPNFTRERDGPAPELAHRAIARLRRTLAGS